MHDPKTVAFEIRNPLSLLPGKKPYDYSPLITIWHADPDINGDDDSCGWFIRSRHMDKSLLEKIHKEFLFEAKHSWFDAGGVPKFSVSGIVLNMFSQASWTMSLHRFGSANGRARRHHDRFMRRHLHEILRFAENGFDSVHYQIVQAYNAEQRQKQMWDMTTIIAPYIARLQRPWYKHPRWHIHHWQLQFHFLQGIKRRWWDKCSVCGKRGFKGSAMSDYHGTRIWHQECDTPIPNPAGCGDKAVQPGAN